jgi:hypothetical protein
MKYDTQKRFSEIYPSVEALRLALLDLEMKHKEIKVPTPRRSAPIYLRFLTLLDEQSEPSEGIVHLRLTKRSEHDPTWRYVAVS